MGADLDPSFRAYDLSGTTHGRGASRTADASPADNKQAAPATPVRKLVSGGMCDGVWQNARDKINKDIDQMNADAVDRDAWGNIYAAHNAKFNKHITNALKECVASDPIKKRTVDDAATAMKRAYSEYKDHSFLECRINRRAIDIKERQGVSSSYPVCDEVPTWVGWDLSAAPRTVDVGIKKSRQDICDELKLHLSKHGYSLPTQGLPQEEQGAAIKTANAAIDIAANEMKGRYPPNLINRAVQDLKKDFEMIIKGEKAVPAAAALLPVADSPTGLTDP